MIEHDIRQIILDGIRADAISAVGEDYLFTAAESSEEWDDHPKVYVTAGQAELIDDMTSSGGDAGWRATPITVACLGRDADDAALLRREVTAWLESRLDLRRDLDWTVEDEEAAPRFSQKDGFQKEYYATKVYTLYHC